MYKILFVCHGNICRSPTCEFYFKYIVDKENLTNFIYCESCATSTEEIGNDIYEPTKIVLRKHGIPFTQRKARQISSNDFNNFDLIICMDKENLSSLHTFSKGNNKKVHLLLEYTDCLSEISDPWYTRDFEKAFDEIKLGCDALLKKIKNDLLKFN